MRFIKIANVIALAAGLVLGDLVLAGFGAVGLAFCFLNAVIETDNNPTFQA
ncbi:hypothetical protein [Pseudomonas sp. LB3P58]